MIRSYRTLPAIPNGYPLDDVWSVVVPIARTNLVTNPSLETNTTNWTAIGGSIARSTTQQYHGAYSLAITPTATITDGARFDTVALTSGTTYAYSAKVRGVAGLKYKLCLETTGGVELISVTFLASGRWQWIYGYYTETSSTTRRLTVRKTTGNTSTAIFYLDGAQIEAIAAGETVSTYCDGDQLGLVPNQNPVAFYWTGTPHASSSVRSGLTRAGGMVIPFRKYGFILTAIIGLGLATPQNVATEYARIDGGYDSFARKPTRQFTLTGRFQGATYRQLRDLRGHLADLFDRDLVGQDQRLLLLHHVTDYNGVITTQTARLYAKYQGGLQGNTDSQHAEATPITFTQYLPNVLSDGEAGSALTAQLSVTNANAIAQRSPSGVWSAMSTGMSGGVGAVYAIVRGLDGTIYAGGSFTDAGGSGADNIAAWNGASWSVVGSATAINGSVIALAIGPDGALYAGGTFTNASGIAAADGIAKWNGSAWSALGTGVNAGGDVRTLAFGPDGTLYAGGTFTSMGGVANTPGIAKWNGTAWSAMGTGVSPGDATFALAIIGTTVYAGGTFITMGGVANTVGLAKWNGTAWSALGSAGVTVGAVNALAIGPNNVLYIGGTVPMTINGVAVSGLAKWNGVAATALGTFNNSVYTIAVDRAGLLHVGGVFTVINGVTVPDSFARISGDTISFEDVDLPGTPTIAAILVLGDGTLYVGYTTTGTAIAAATTMIINAGTARAYPALKIMGPPSGTARIYQIANPTTNRVIYLNYTISAGETATLVFQPDSLSFTSDFQGNIASTILPGSNVADFFLQPGANSVAFFAASSTVTATLFYRPAYASLDDVP